MAKSDLLVMLKPLGINMSQMASRPLLLLRDDSGELTLPLPISPLDAGVLMQQAGKAATMWSPHQVTVEILKLAQLEPERCVFIEIRGGAVWGRLEFKNQKAIEMRADYLVSLCLYLNVPIFATADLIWRARHQVFEIQEQDGLMLFQSSAFRPHEYLM
ncbi:MAG: DUF151 domain-containing protein [Bdellovibrionaceae bacterium]|nr:DUF151 domain-containing protein [Pseudobdellovibrionaceae bacterium]MDW8189412.1 hypothetical protein [Pseudobdellovibrionaceae bacterium]